MSFTEASIVANLIRDLLCGSINHHTAVGAGLRRECGRLADLGWHYLRTRFRPRETNEVFVDCCCCRDAAICNASACAESCELVNDVRGTLSDRLAGEMEAAYA